MNLIQIKNNLISKHKDECKDILEFIKEADQLNMKINLTQLKSGNIKLTASKTIEVHKKYLVGIIGEQMITKKDLTEALEPILEAIKANGDAIKENRDAIKENRDAIRENRDAILAISSRLDNIVKLNNLKEK